MGDQELTRRLEELATREALKELRARYCWYASRGDYERMTQLYTPDGVFEFMAEGKRLAFRGHDGIRECLRKTTHPGLVFPMVHNDVLVITGAEAVGTCGMEARTTSKEMPAFSGYYHDRFRRIEGQWFFAERRFFRYWPAFERSGLDIDGTPESGLSAQHERKPG